MELYDNDELVYDTHGNVLNPDFPCQAIVPPTWLTFDSRKRDRAAFPDINLFDFYFPIERNVYGLYLKEFQFPLFASLGQNDWVVLVISHMSVMREAIGSHSVTINTQTALSNITLQAPHVEVAAGAGTCLWNWRQSGQTPAIYTPREGIQQMRVQLLDSLGNPVQTGVAAGALGPPMRLVFAIEHK
jgi:hypothetical protein